MPLINLLNVCREHTSLHVSASGSEEDIVWVPVDGKHSRSDRLLQQLRDPPVVLGVEGTDGDRTE